MKPWSLFAGDMIAFIENPKESPKKNGTNKRL